MEPYYSQNEYERPPKTGKQYSITEKTSKRYKLMQVVGVGFMLISGLFFMAGFPELKEGRSSSSIVAAGAFVFIGICIWIVAGVLSWWHHG